jgi:hypothetical protein
MKEVTIPLKVVEYLETIYPLRDFTPDKSLREIDYHNGQRSVVRFLRSKYNEQNENILTTNPYRD